MLRTCFGRLCCSSVIYSVNVGSRRLTSSSYHHDSTSLERLVEPFVPFTFTALTQISCCVDDELMEKVAEAGGLRYFLISHPDLFSVSKVGDVYVARRLRKQVGRAQPVCRVGAREGSGKTKEYRRQQPEGKFFSLLSPEPSFEVLRLFPTFFVSVDALVMHVRESPGETPWRGIVSERISHTGANANTAAEEVVRSCIEKNRHFIDYVSVVDTCDGVAMRREFVRLRPSVADSAGVFWGRKFKEGEKDKRRNIDELMESHCVQEYEQFRVARLIFVAEKLVPISSEMRSEAMPLLPEGRSLIHVFVSAPELFELCGTTSGLSVRFILHPHYIPQTTRTKEEIKCELEKIKEGRVRNGIRVPVDRRKRRLFLRQLCYLESPTPYLDERVWAYALLDALPPDSPVAVGGFISTLSNDRLCCTPPNLRGFFSRFSYLFSTFDGDKEMLLQRADIPLPKMSPVVSIKPEDILLMIYNNYPRRRHPNCGTCLERCLYILPSQARARLNQLDFVEDVLRRFPEKVELIDGFDLELIKKKSVSEHMRYRLQLFRFVGEYQEELIKRFEALCVKHGCDPDKMLLS